MRAGSLTLEQTSYGRVENLPRRTHRDLVVPELESQGVAFRVPNGPCGDPENLVIENRRSWAPGIPDPVAHPNVLVPYGMDPRRRRVIRVDGEAVRSRGGYISSGEPWWHCWGLENSRQLTGAGPALQNSLNHAGEHWWSFEDIRVDGERMLVDAVYQPYDLIEHYTNARWRNGETDLVPGLPAAASGNVFRTSLSQPMAADGARYEGTLSLHPQWKPYGQVNGTYDVAVPACGARLYLTGMLQSGTEGSDGVRLTIMLSADGGRSARAVASAPVEPGRARATVVLDLTAWAGRDVQLTLRAEAGPTSYRDWIHVVDAVVVPTAAPARDLLAELDQAEVRSGGPVVPLERFPRLDGPRVNDRRPSARWLQQERLRDGRTYAGGVLELITALNAPLDVIWRAGVPADARVLRLQAGLGAGRQVEGDVRVADLQVLIGEDVVLPTTSLVVSPTDGDHGTAANPTLCSAVDVSGLAGDAGPVTLRVVPMAGASSSVCVTSARLCTD